MGRKIIVVNFHKKTLRMRAIDRILCTREFEDALERAGESEIISLHRILEQLDIPILQQWIFELLYGPMEHLSHRQLRELAKNMNVSRWSRLSKDELIEELEACTKRSET